MEVIEVSIDQEIANVRQAAAARLGQQLTYEQARSTLTWWHHATDGLLFSSGWVGTVGVRAYNWLRAKHGADKRGIAGAQRIESLDADAASRDMTLHHDWLRPDGRQHEHGWLTELDVNGQYLAACDIDLGTGQPQSIGPVRILTPYLRCPGSVRLARGLDETQLREHLPAVWPGLVHLDAGRTIAMPLARWLVKSGIDVQAQEVIWWQDKRRHLSAWKTLFKNARFRLATAAATGATPGAGIALALVKSVTNVTLGGWLRSAEHNHSDLMRKDWSDQIITEAGVRSMVAAQNTHAFGTVIAGMRRDAIWVLGDQNARPPGLVIDTMFHPEGNNGQLGKWKLTRSVPVESIAAGLESDSPAVLVRDLKQAWEMMSNG